MIYLSRPIFTYPFNWAEALQKSFSFDLRAMQIGFGPEVYAPKQLHVVRGFEFTTLAACLGDIAWLEDFFNQLYGPLTGFWLPTDQAEMTVKAAVDATHFDIVSQSLVDTWQDSPAIYLWFTRLGIVPQAAKITAVATIDATTERVTVDTAVPLLGGDTGVGSIKVSRLLYVRLAGDEEQTEFIAEQFQRRTVRVVELPTEYITWETGERPVFLYHFFVKYPDTQQDWYFTSFAESLTVGDHTYAPAPISHGELATSTRADKEELKIDAFFASGNPLALFIPFAVPFPMRVEVLETALPSLSAPSSLFSGQVQTVQAKGKALTADCVSVIDAMERKLPRFLLQTRCNYAVFVPETCQLDPAAYKITGTISAINDRTITISAAALASNAPNQGTPPPDHWFAEGSVVIGTGTSKEIRTILDSAVVDSTHHTLTLNRALHVNTTGAAAVVLPGCDHRALTCQNNFNNFVNFGGHPYLPQDNQIFGVAKIPSISTGKK